MDDIVRKLHASAVGADPLARVLRAIAQGGSKGEAVTRTVLADELGLSPATISKAVSDLTEASTRLVVEIPTREDGGRIQKTLGLEQAHYASVGVRIDDRGGHASRLVGVLTALNGRLLARVDHDLNPDASEPGVKQIAAVAGELIDVARRSQRTVLGVGLQLGGQVVDGTVIRSVNTAWQGLTLGPPLEKELGVPTVVENDVTALMVLDHLTTSRSGRWPNRALIAVFDEGVGAGLVINDTVYRGSHGLATEIGHLCVDYAPDSSLCRCGQRGCLEAFLPPSAITRWTTDHPDAPPQDAFTSAGTVLGRALVDLVHIVDVGYIQLLLPNLYASEHNPHAGHFHTALDTQLHRLFSPESRPHLEFTYSAAEATAEQNAAASAAIVLEKLLDQLTTKN